MNNDDIKIHEELHKRYTQHLAEAMGNTREILVSKILSENVWVKPSWEIEVNFDE
jgi:maltooligosyltrehalose synthase